MNKALVCSKLSPARQKAAAFSRFLTYLKSLLFLLK